MSIAQQFFEAVKAGDAAQVQALLASNPELAHARDSDSLTPVMRATYAGRQQVADLLIDQGADVDIFAAAALGQTDRLKTLVQSGPQLVSAYSPDGWTPLHLAAHFGQTEAAQVLLARGADIHARSTNSMCNTPLHAAMPTARRAMVELLLANGAEVNATQEGGFTALHEAAFQGNQELISVLLASGADARLRTDTGQTAQDLALEQGHSDAAHLLASL